MNYKLQYDLKQLTIELKRYIATKKLKTRLLRTYVYNHYFSVLLLLCITLFFISTRNKRTKKLLFSILKRSQIQTVTVI